VLPAFGAEYDDIDDRPAEHAHRAHRAAEQMPWMIRAHTDRGAAMG